MYYNSNFAYDLEVGKVAEKMLGDIFEGAKVEVKRDLLADKTGNVFIEYSSRGEDSGIITTEADYWAIFTSDTIIHIIKVRRLHELAYNFRHRKTCGGDNNTSWGVLIPIGELR